MKPGNVAEARQLSKRFRPQKGARKSLKESLIESKQRQDDIWALQEINLELRRGETLGLIGRNGSGKSTFLRLVAGIYKPTSGSVRTVGRVATLLELGAGFHPDMTGRENIFLNAALLGINRRQIREVFADIVEFSGLSEFIDMPVKYYSSGMYVRLGFSVTAHLDPEILLMDEILAVGDEDFQRKSLDHVHGLKQRGTSIVLVSHSLSSIQAMCDRVVWLEAGRIAQQGAPESVIEAYLAEVNTEEAQEAASTASDSENERHDSIEITSLEYLDRDGQVTGIVVKGESLRIRLHYLVHDAVSDAILGLDISHPRGFVVTSVSSRESAIDIAPRAGRSSVDLVLDSTPFQPGLYDVSVYAGDPHRVKQLKRFRFPLTVRASHGVDEEIGVIDLPFRWEEGPSDPAVAQRR